MAGSVVGVAQGAAGVSLSPVRSGGLRKDIQGLRAVAVGLVLAFHAGVGFLPGGYVGVDVFFVISGFLITGLIVREVRSTGHLNLGRFYARRARRLLPATAVTFVGVAVLTVAVLPVTRWASVAGDMVASSLYVVNWRLAARSVEYLAEGAAASPLQHFWSLAVEEQFYIVWPLLIVALTWWAKRRGSSSAGEERGLSVGRLMTGLLVIVLPSLAWSVYLTATDPGPAYFVTTTRLWELGIGALLAVGAVQAARAPVVVRAVAGWLGLAAIGWSAVMFTAETQFPGSAALVPTLGAAAVLWAGLGDGRARVRVLDVAPLQDVGALSYSLYLWHWPVLVAATALWGDKDGHLWLPTALLAVAASAVPAWFTYRVVEQPLHLSPRLAAPWRAGVVGLVCIAVGLGSAGAITWSLDRERAAEAAQAVPTTIDTFGAAALGDDPTTSPAGIPVDVVDSITPGPADAGDDVADVYGDGCHQDQEHAEVLTCTYGDQSSDTRIALVGDSHAAQWEPALRLLAEENGWRLETYTKSACLFADVDVWLGNIDGPYTSCAEWSRSVTAELSANPPGLVVVSSSGSYQAAGDAAPRSREESLGEITDGIARTWQDLRASGSEVVVITDTPWPGMDMSECVAEHQSTLTECAVPREEAVTRSGAAMQREAASKVQAGVEMVDLTDYICPQSECSAVIGGVLVVRDSHHLTATYARSLVPMLGKSLEAAVGR